MNVTAVNDAPSGADKTVTASEDSAYTFATADFGFSDVTDAPGNNLSGVKITAISGSGNLTNNGAAVNNGDVIAAADIAAGKLRFTPLANTSGAAYASFSFQVQDDGGSANGGVDLDASPNTMTVDVASVNDAPAGADNAVTTLEDTAYTFAAADFGFTDAADTPAKQSCGGEDQQRSRRGLPRYSCLRGSSARRMSIILRPGCCSRSAR